MSQKEFLKLHSSVRVEYTILTKLLYCLSFAQKRASVKLKSTIFVRHTLDHLPLSVATLKICGILKRSFSLNVS